MKLAQFKSKNSVSDGLSKSLKSFYSTTTSTESIQRIYEPEVGVKQKGDDMKSIKSLTIRSFQGCQASAVYPSRSTTCYNSLCHPSDRTCSCSSKSSDQKYNNCLLGYSSLLDFLAIHETTIMDSSQLALVAKISAYYIPQSFLSFFLLRRTDPSPIVRLAAIEVMYKTKFKLRPDSAIFAYLLNDSSCPSSTAQV